MKKTLLPLLLILLPGLASAATLRFDPPLRSLAPGDVFVATMRIDVAQGECVNAATVSIAYPPQLLQVQALSFGESIFSLWLDQQIDSAKGEAHFVGGIPGGYCGRAAGDPGQSNIVAKIAFQYKGSQNTDVANINFLPDTEVDLNDGLGTKATLTTVPLSVQYAATSSSHNEWLDIVQQDAYPPEEFTPEVFKDSTNPNSPYYLIFDATDKQSGIEHYEVLEDDPSSFGFRFGSRIKARFAPATSPYLLQDQSLSSRIVVRAYDHAGNMQEEIIPPKNYRSFLDQFSVNNYAAPIIALIVCIILFFIFFRYFRKDETKNMSGEESDRETLK